MHQKVHGISSADDGSFLLTTCEKTPGGWRLLSRRRWSCDNAFRNALLFHRGVAVAAPCRWMPAKPAAPPPTAAEHARGPVAPRAESAVIENLASRLYGNLLCVVPDDAFLCALPLALDQGAARSFISVFCAGRFYKIGIIADAAFIAVFSMAPAGPGALDGHLGRIQRYLLAAAPHIPWPSDLYLLGSGDVPLDSGFTVHTPDLGRAGIDISDIDTVRSAGAALGQSFGFAPLLAGASPGAAGRRLRSAVLACSAAIVACGLLLALSLPAATFVAGRRLSAYREQYRLILAQTPELRALTLTNDSLARAVLLARDINASRTHWTRMFETLGTLRPDGLYLDMIGTDGAAATGKVGLALAGWARNESLVTGFIAALAKNGQYSAISLSSLERNETRNIFTFRIACTFRHSGGLPEK
jgi:Tfp pilus assembly protein PilN